MSTGDSDPFDEQMRQKLIAGLPPLPDAAMGPARSARRLGESIKLQAAPLVAMKQTRRPVGVMIVAILGLLVGVLGSICPAFDVDTLAECVRPRSSGYLMAARHAYPGPWAWFLFDSVARDGLAALLFYGSIAAMLLAPIGRRLMIAYAAGTLFLQVADNVMDQLFHTAWIVEHTQSGIPLPPGAPTFARNTRPQDVLAEVIVALWRVSILLVMYSRKTRIAFEPRLLLKTARRSIQ